MLSTYVTPSSTLFSNTIFPNPLSPKLHLLKNPSSSHYPHHALHSLSSRTQLYIPKSSQDTNPEAELSNEEGELDEWLSRLPEKNKPLYAHSLPCIEAWLRSLGFHQSKDDRAVWFIEKTDWHAQLSLDITELYIRYLKSGPGKMDKEMERRFSYALSREDIENAVLGGP